MDEDLKKALDDLREKLKEANEAKIKEAEKNHASKVKELTDKIEALKKEIEAKEAEAKKAAEEAKADLQKQFDEWQVKQKEKTSKAKSVSFEDALNDALKENAADLKNLSEKKAKEVSFSMKAATDEDFNMSNFANGEYAKLTTETRGLYQNPFMPIWLRTLLPNATTQSSTIYYPRYTGSGDGAVGVWDGSGDIASLSSKPGVNFDIDDVTETVKWIAGVTRVKREMLDDIAWLRSFIAQQLTVGRRGLFVAENTQIINTLDTNSTAYDGSLTLLIEQIYEAAFGQLADNYMNADLIIMNSRDLVKEVILNKASTSGLYNLPAGTVATVNGNLSVGGIRTIGLPESTVPSGTAYVVDTRQTQFVSRMSPDIRAFEEDRDNVVKNLITFRTEERIATLVFDTNAVVKIEATT